MALSVDKIVPIALALLNEVGLDKLSTRRLAIALNVQGPALYKHFSSKAQLLDYMATTLLTDSFAQLDVNVSWQDWLRGLAQASRNGALQYQDGARLLTMSSPNTFRRLQVLASVSAPLITAGFDERAAHHATALIASFVSGWVQSEQNEETHAMMIEHYKNITDAFNEGVEVIIAGIDCRRNVRRDTSEL